MTVWKAAAVIAALGWSGIAAAQDEAGPPVAPAGLVESFALPAQDAGGVWATPNRALTPAETVWHLRVALNVAALGCRGEGEARMVAAYNVWLDGAKAALAEASDGTAAAYRVRAGAGWQAAYDGDMTRLYNFWAQPAVHDGFCAAADAVLQEAAVVEPGNLGWFAADALSRLEAPFIAFFDAAARYRTAMATWRAARAPQVAAVLPTSAP